MCLLFCTRRIGDLKNPTSKAKVPISIPGTYRCCATHEIKAGLRPDACADDGRTALHLAAGEGASKGAAKLVELGADVKRADRQGRNALEIARAAGYYDLEARLRLLSES